MISKEQNYLVVEAMYGEEPQTSENIYSILDDDSKESFTEVFKFKTADEIVNYENFDDFVTVMLDISERVFSEGYDSLMITAIDGKKKIFMWSIKIIMSVSDQLLYKIIDWAESDSVFSYESNIYPDLLN